jgi:type IV secretory pathway component VirB8
MKTKEKISLSFSKEVKLKSPDYANVTQEEAVADFLSRIQQYERRYEPIDDKTDEKNYSFIKIFNCGERFLVHKIGGKLIYLSNSIHTIFYSRSYSKPCGLFSYEYSCYTKNDLSNPSK